jgi:hypothetical protein
VTSFVDRSPTTRRGKREVERASLRSRSGPGQKRTLDVTGTNHGGKTCTEGALLLGAHAPAGVQDMSKLSWTQKTH